MTKRDLIVGSGGKSKKKARTPVEAPDNLRSVQYAEVVDLLCEGEIEGLADGAKSIYLDETPLQNPDSTYNFDRFDWTLVTGTQEQEPLPGIRNPGAEVSVGIEVKAASPVTRQIANPEIDAVRITLFFPQLTHQSTSNGDINGTSVQLAIDVQVDGGGFVQKVIDTVSGKTTSGYQRSYYIRLPTGTARDVRVRRLTADSTQSVLQNTSVWASYTEVIETRLRYPNSALVGIRVDAEQFGSIPTRGYDLKLLKVRVPSNYNPATRTYSGVWDGTWSAPVWTDNPVWCWYDLVTEDRYGLGSFIDAAVIDKWSLYEIAQYCDELVPDGFNGYEPRFTLNIYLQTREEAWKVVQQLAAVFRAMVFASTSGVMAVQDRPSDPVKQFTVANTVDGMFSYQGTAKNARHTVALVAWNDPDDMYRQKIEYVEDEDGIDRFGIRETEVVALGCTSRGQAHRLGKHILYSEQYETETVTFRTGLEGAGIAPGDIIQTSDAARSGERMGGRIISASTSQITLDAPITMKPGRTYTINVILPTGELQERGVIFNGVEQTVSTLSLSAPFSIAPQVMGIWVVSASDLMPELWKVMGIVEVEPHIIEVTALSHNPSKFAAIDYDTKLTTRPVSSIRFKQSPVTNVTAQTTTYQVNTTTFSTRILVSWTAPLEGASYYLLQYRRGSDNWKTQETSNPSDDIDNVLEGTYEIAVVAVNSIGRQSVPVTISHVVDTDNEAVASVSGLRLAAPFTTDDASFLWDAFPGAQHYEVEIWAGAANRLTTTSLEPRFTYTFLQNLQNGGPFRTIEIRVKARTLLGSSTLAATLSATNPQVSAPAFITTLDTGSGIQVATDIPDEIDWKGTIIWIENTPTFDPLSTTPKYNGPNNVYQHEGLESGDWYVCAAHYDKFGQDSLNVSTKVSEHVTKMAAGVEKVLDASVISAPPGSPPPGGDAFWAVYSQHDMKMWRWNTDLGKYESSVDGNDILANTIVANKLAISELSSISANLGNATAGTFTLSSLGFIRGGATSWTVGKGFWEGYHNGEYKWRVGTPGESGASWDGSKFTIYGPDGSVTLESGTNLSTTDDYARQLAQDAIDTATAADNKATSANNAMLDISSDAKFTPVEKQQVRTEWGGLIAEKPGIVTQANNFGVGTELSAYESAFQGLANYLNAGVTWASGVPSWISDANLGTTTTIVGATFRDTFASFYGARQALLNKIAQVASEKATWSAVYGRPTSLSGLNSTEGAKLSGVETGATVGANSSNLAAGRGVNMLHNAGMALSLDGWLSYGGTTGLNLGGWCIRDGGARYGTFYIQAGATGEGALYIDNSGDSKRIPVIPGRRYEAYAYTGAHRCNVSVLIDFRDASGNVVAATGISTVNGGANNAEKAGGTALSGYKQIGYFATAPTGAVSARIVIYKGVTLGGASDSWLFATLPYFGEASAGQTELSPWAEGSSGINTKIDSSNVSTYMADAAIRSAQIGEAQVGKAHIQDASVDTLLLAGNAVTVPIATSTASVSRSASTNDYTTDVTLGSITTHPDGRGTVTLFLAPSNGAMTATSTVFGVGSDLSSNTHIFQLLRNGTVVHEFIDDEQTLSNSSRLVYWTMVHDAPGPGVTCNYTLRTRTVSYPFSENHSHAVSALSVLILETRR